MDIEHHHQAHLITWATFKAKTEFPCLDTIYAIPNGGNRNIVTATKLKREGVKRGVPDLHLPVARHGFHSLYIEMKKPALKPKRGGKGGVSADQEDWHKRLRREGNKVAVCYSADEGKRVIEDYLKS